AAERVRGASWTGEQRGEGNWRRLDGVLRIGAEGCGVRDRRAERVRRAEYRRWIAKWLAGARQDRPQRGGAGGRGRRLVRDGGEPGGPHCGSGRGRRDPRLERRPRTRGRQGLWF